MNGPLSLTSSLPDGVQIRAIEADEFHLVLDCLETAFPDVRRGFFHAITLNDPAYQSAFSLAVEHDGRVLSYLQIFDRTLRLNGEAVRFGGIGSVGTRPDCRGRGYSQALLKRAIEVMQQYEMRGSILFTQIQPFYEKLGWKTVVQTEYEISVKNVSSLGAMRKTVRPMRDSDRQAIEMIYQDRLADLKNGCERSAEFWAARPTWMNHPCFVLPSDDGGVDAYFWCSQYNPKIPLLGISEYGYRKDDPAVLSALLSAMAKKARDMNCEAVRGPFRQDAKLFSFIESNRLKATPWENDYLMWRDLNQSGLEETIQQAAASGHFLFWPTDAF
ncbi:MAG: GNAT family N-acetyltransferase [Candidatus Hinthialibacter antarcticus]|nr:GNAT family N-acetyltransferase [Candidatus Hinthialibacter antarcticus]